MSIKNAISAFVIPLLFLLFPVISAATAPELNQFNIAYYQGPIRGPDPEDKGPSVPAVSIKLSSKNAIEDEIDLDGGASSDKRKPLHCYVSGTFGNIDHYLHSGQMFCTKFRDTVIPKGGERGQKRGYADYEIFIRFVNKYSKSVKIDWQFCRETIERIVYYTDGSCRKAGYVTQGGWYDTDFGYVEVDANDYVTGK